MQLSRRKLFALAAPAIITPGVLMKISPLPKASVIFFGDSIGRFGEEINLNDFTSEGEWKTEGSTMDGIYYHTYVTTTPRPGQTIITPPLPDFTIKNGEVYTSSQTIIDGKLIVRLYSPAFCNQEDSHAIT